MKQTEYRGKIHSKVQKTKYRTTGITKKSNTQMSEQTEQNLQTLKMKQEIN